MERGPGVLVAVVVVFLALPAQGQPRCDKDAEDKSAALFEQGKRAYRLQEHAQAIDAFKGAYALCGDPELLYNIGLAYRQSGDLANAIAFFRSYLAEKPDAPDRAKLEERIAEMRATLDDPPAAPSPSPEPAPPPPAVTAAQPPMADTPRPPRRTARWVALGLAATAVVLGGVSVPFFLEIGDARDAMHREVDAAGGEFTEKAAAEDERAARAELTAWILAGTASAAVVGAGVVYLLGGREARDAATVAVSPIGGSWAVVVGGRF